MTIHNMHYDFKMKYNKVDTKNFRNLLIPEIDWLLNNAALYFIKDRAETRIKKHLGFETSQHTIDDIRILVKVSKFNFITSNKIQLPSDYNFYVRGRAVIRKKDCTIENVNLSVQQHGDQFDNELDGSSFEWEQLNGLFRGNEIVFFADDFRVDSFDLTYIRKMSYMHNAARFRNGSYKTDQITYSGTNDCELPSHTHPEIVDIAVKMAIQSISGGTEITNFET